MDFDPIAHDPPQIDAQYPPSTQGFSFESGGVQLFGTFHLTQGQGRHPTALFLHGFPGNERNFDLAHALMRAGWNAVTFAYRGAWGSGGDFTYAHVLEDARNAVAWLRMGETARQYRVDGRRIALIGYSMGAWAALHTTVDDPDLIGTVALAPWNVGRFGADAAAMDGETRKIALQWVSSLAKPLKAQPEALLDEILAHTAEWDLLPLAAVLARRNLLLIGAGEDDETPLPVHFHPLVRALRAEAAHLDAHVMEGVNHDFAGRRVTLTRLVVDWLQRLV